MRAITTAPLISTAVLLLAGCSMNPKLILPAAPVASTYPLSTGETANGANLAWREMFGDPRLQQLIEIGLSDNRELRTAVLNVEAARSQFRVQRGAQLPAVDAQGTYTRQRLPTSVAGAGVGLDPNQTGNTGPSATGIEFGQFTAQAALTTFEIDLFGRLRSQTQAAFERYLGTAEGSLATRIAVIGTIADAYLAERLATEQLRLTETTLTDWRASLKLIRLLRDAGQNSGIEIAEQEGLVRQAEADLEQRRRELAQATNALVLAVGAPLPNDLPPPFDLMKQPIVTQLPAGLPSDLLARRPDILRAEHELRAANADVGAARAAFFPRLSLTAAFGFASLALDQLFKGANRSWSVSPQIAAPIFQGGQLKGSLDLARVRSSIAVNEYERTIQSAFREVADGLAARATFSRQVEAQVRAAAANDTRVRLSNLRFRAGVESRLEVLDAQRSSYTARQAVLNVRQQELSSAIGLYRALGGGVSRGNMSKSAGNERPRYAVASER